MAWADDDQLGDATTGALPTLLEALLASRPTPANDRFDAEVEAAVAAGRLDVATARALRYRQRASVEAVENYLRTTLLATLRAHRTAADHAVADVASEDEAWTSASTLAAAVAPSARPTEPTEPAEPVRPAEPVGLPVRLTAVPDLEVPVRPRTADETEAAIRAALQS